MHSTAPVGNSEGNIYVSGYRKRLHAFNPDGTLNWTFSGKNTLYENSPVIGPDGTIYIIGSNESDSENSFLHAVNPDGSEKWSFHIESKQTNPDSYNGRYGIALSKEGTLYFSNDRGYLYAVNSDDGKLKWRKDYFGTGTDGRTPVIGEDGNIYFNEISGYVMSVDPDGKLLWYGDLGSNKVLSSPAIGSDGKLYVTTQRSKQLFDFGPIADILSKIETNSTDINVGDLVKATITIDNLGPDIAFNTIMNFAIPDGFEYVSSNNTNITYDPITKILSWKLNPLSKNKSDMIDVILKAMLPGNHDLNVSSTSTVFDNNINNNNASINVNINPASDLITKITTNNTNPTINDLVTITVNNTNLGPSDTTNIKTLIEIPEGFEFVSTDNQNAIYDPINRIITWTTDTLEANTNSILNIVLKAIKEGPQTINSTTTSDNYDQNKENNNASTTIEIKLENQANSTIDNNNTDQNTNTELVKAKESKLPLKNTGIPIGLLVVLLISSIIIKIKK